MHSKTTYIMKQSMNYIVIVKIAQVLQNARNIAKLRHIQDFFVKMTSFLL
eukprot:TRINITY_DN13581_c0_g1_i1.p2 TRINITY_DN13581_c0_g1~~TRINITY_DN13581_c0_g1_i1.p2  ORF type:complete len:50 (+),score=2.09 TRINITY_DN13581_c0_g1_i1:435-584(+)